MVTRHKYYPFGEEATIPPPDDGPMKFTGHERDFFEEGEGDDLDYMHARYCSPLMGRFLSVDPVGGDPAVPQSLNRFSYVRANPLNAYDPSGEELFFAGDAAHVEEAIRLLNERLNGLQLTYDAKTNRVGLRQTAANGPASDAQVALGAVLELAITEGSTTLQLVSGDSGVYIGRFDSAQVDVADIAALGDGPAANISGAFGHEIVEQFAKQSLGFVQEGPGRPAHLFANDAQARITGYTRIGDPVARLNRLGSGTTTTLQRGPLAARGRSGYSMTLSGRTWWVS
jgi:RHS repeat-associated protein